VKEWRAYAFTAARRPRLDGPQRAANSLIQHSCDTGHDRANLAAAVILKKKREAGSYLTNYLVGFLGVSRENVRLMHQPISLKG
jgi:hypothetical protein